MIRAEHPDLVLIYIILGFSEILLAEAPAGDPRRRDLEEIHKAATTALDPIRRSQRGRGRCETVRYMPMTLLDGRLANAAGRAVVCALVLTLSTLNSWADEKASASATGDAGVQEQSSVAELKKMSVEDLMRVEVTTISRRESTIGQSPAAVSVITQEDIRRSGATTFPELFRRVPGMDVARIDNNKWAVSVRGLNDRFQRFLLVQVDGRTVYSATFAGVYWDALDYPLEDIERIEVIRGPGASVWGANAVNGIINIITKSAKDTQGGLVSGGGGSEERGFGTIRYGGNITDDLSYRAHGKGFRRDEQFSETGNPNDGWWGASGGFRLDWLASGRNAVTFDAGYLRSEAGRRDSRPMISAPFVFTNIEAEVSNAPHVLARWSHKVVNEESSWSLQVYWDRFIRIFQNLDVYQRWDTYDVDFQHQFPFGDRNKVVWALGYRVVDSHLGNSGHDNGFILSYLPNDSRQRLYSTLVQDQISLVEDKLELTLGSKFEHNDFTGFEAQPTTRLLWTPTKRQSIWAAASRAVRTPSVADDELRSTLLQSTPGVGPFPLGICPARWSST